MYDEKIDYKKIEGTTNVETDLLCIMYYCLATENMRVTG